MPFQSKEPRRLIFDSAVDERIFGKCRPSACTRVDGVFEITQVLDGVLSGLRIPDHREVEIMIGDEIIVTFGRFSFYYLQVSLRLQAGGSGSQIADHVGWRAHNLELLMLQCQAAIRQAS